MKQHRLPFYIPAALALLFLILAGCGGDDDDDDESTTADKEEALCLALVDLRIQVVELRQGPTPTSVGEIRYRLEQLNEAWQNVEDLAEDVENAHVEDVDTAQEDLKKAIEDLPDDMAVDEARQEIQPEIQALADAQQALAEDMNCLPGFIPTPDVSGATIVPVEPTPTVMATATETPTVAPTETPAPPTETPVPSPTPEPTATVAEPTVTEIVPTSTEAASVPTPPAGQLIYEADWSEGAGDWVLGASWSVEGGVLRSDGSAAESLVAPFEIETGHYAIEAEIQVEAEESPACPEIIGLMARVVPQAENPTLYEAGYTAGICAGEWELAAVSEPDEAAIETPLNRLGTGPFELDGEPHLYRFEVNGDQLRFFVDGQLMGETTNGEYSDAGSTGIYLNGNYIATVTSFKIIELE